MEKINAGKVHLRDGKHPFWDTAAKSSVAHTNENSDAVFIDVSRLLYEERECDEGLRDEKVMGLIELLDKTPAFEGWRDVEVLFVLP